MGLAFSKHFRLVTVNFEHILHSSVFSVYFKCGALRDLGPFVQVKKRE